MLERGLLALAHFMLHGEYNVLYEEQAHGRISNVTLTTSGLAPPPAAAATAAATTATIPPSPATTILNDVGTACKMLEKLHHYRMPIFTVHPPVDSSQTSSSSSLSEHPVRDGLWNRLCYFITSTTSPSTTTTTITTTTTSTATVSQVPSQIPRSPSQMVPLSFSQSLSLITNALAVGAGEVAISLAVGAARRNVCQQTDPLPYLPPLT